MVCGIQLDSGGPDSRQSYKTAFQESGQNWATTEEPLVLLWLVLSFGFRVSGWLRVVSVGLKPATNPKPETRNPKRTEENPTDSLRYSPQARRSFRGASLRVFACFLGVPLPERGLDYQS